MKRKTKILIVLGILSVIGSIMMLVSSCTVIKVHDSTDVDIKQSTPLEADRQFEVLKFENKKDTINKPKRKL